MNDRYIIGTDDATKTLDGRSFMLDTNIWLLINGPFTNRADHRTRKYSWFYGEILKAKASMVLPQMIVSEFVNRCVKWQAEVAGWNGSGKVHRQGGYADWVQAAADDLYHMLPSCAPCDDDFASCNLDECLKWAAANSIDFNDVIISRICQKRSLTLVTDDIDYQGEPIDIVTANPAYRAAKQR